MIEQRRIEKIWKRSVLHLLAVVAVGLAILVYYLYQRVQNEPGPTFLDIGSAFLILTLAGAILYFVGRLIKNEIGRRYGKD